MDTRTNKQVTDKASEQKLPSAEDLKLKNVANNAEIAQKETGKLVEAVEQNIPTQDPKQTTSTSQHSGMKEQKLPTNKLTEAMNVERAQSQTPKEAVITTKSASKEVPAQKQITEEIKTAYAPQMPQNLLAKSFTNPYARTVVQPAVTGGAIGVTFFPVHAFIVGLQNRPPGMSSLDYFKNLKPKSSPNQSIYQAVKEMFWMNSRFIGRGVKYSCTTSFTKSMFTCNGPMVQKHIEHDFGLLYGKDLDPATHSEQSPFRTTYNKWFLTGAISSLFGLTEAAMTSNTSAKATCSMLKKDIIVQGFYNNLMFAPGGVTRSCKAGFGQFAFIGTEHIADYVKLYFPEKNYGFFATALSASMTGFIGGGVGTVFDNLYILQMRNIQQHNPNSYGVPSMYKMGSYIYHNIGFKGYMRGALPNMMTMPAIFLIAQGINEVFNKQAAAYNRANSRVANGFTLFGAGRPSQDIKKPPVDMENPKNETINRRKSGP